MPDDLTRARDLVGRAERVVVFTGAGVSAESGVPTFRGPGGLWKTFRPEQLATPEAFARDPRLVWEWYGWRREILAACRPNPAHVAIARWMLARQGVTLISQNVDDLHERGAEEAAQDLARAGASCDDAAVRPAAARAAAEVAGPLRLHGSIFHVRCRGCRTRTSHREPIDASSVTSLPHCAACGGLLRPDVVWFGEALPEGVLATGFAAAAAAQVCLVIGTTGAVHPASAIAHETRASGGRVVVVDPGVTDYDAVAEVRLWGPAGRIVPELLRTV